MSNELVKLGSGELAKIETLEAQFALLKKFGLPETAAERNVVVFKDGHYTLQKRENPISIYPDDNGNLRSVVQVQKTHSERIGLSAARGKYNDENRLYAQDAASLDVGEIVPWATI